MLLYLRQLLIWLPAFGLCWAAIGAGPAAGQAPAGQSGARPAIYDAGLDVKARIAEAVKTAQAENRHILLQFGANWCPWCHRLHDLFQTDPAIRELLAKSFHVIMVDTGGRNTPLINQDLVDQYHVRSLGLPALVVLGPKGEVLCIQSTGVLEKGKAHDPAKVLAFLQIHAPAARQ